MFAGRDSQRNALERRPFLGRPAHYGNVTKSQERRSGHLEFGQDENYLNRGGPGNKVLTKLSLDRFTAKQIYLELTSKDRNLS